MSLFTSILGTFCPQVCHVSSALFVRWKKGELLGQGSFGKVYAALNQNTGEMMAVKVSDPHLSSHCIIAYLLPSSYIASHLAALHLGGDPEVSFPSTSIISILS